MHRVLSIFFCLFAVHGQLRAQTFPKEGAKVHYRIIGFSFEKVKQVSEYKLEIAKGYYNSDDSFRKNIIISVTSAENRKVVEAPDFGSQYTWQVSYVTKGNTPTQRIKHHFSIGTVPEADTNIVRFRVIDKAVKYKDAYVFLDGNNGLYDMAGHLVWYMPQIDTKANTHAQVNDLKMTPQGTITFMENNRAYEINYNGDILWRSPVKIGREDSIEHYHHEFTRLSNGHYMVLSSESVLWKPDLPPEKDSSLYKATGGRMKNDTNKTKTHFGTVIEYDEKGNMVWSWKSSSYFMQSDVKYFNPKLRRQIIDVHENSFFFDEKNGYIYVSFKNISRIVKVKYPEGNVVAAYGEVYKPDVPQTGNGLFCSQHSCKISDDGYLYLFNNNNCDSDGIMPTVVMMREPGASNGALEKVWEYTCTDDGISENPLFDRKAQEEKVRAKHPNFKSMNMRMMHPTSGGSVTELPDHSFFVSMNNEYSKVFIVDRDKKVLWSGVSEKWNAGENRWIIILQYRASLVNSRKLLESMIWKGRSI